MIDKELELELKREVFKKSYFEFFKWSFNILMPGEEYVDNFHVKYLCDILQEEVLRVAARKEKNKDIIINIPPRTSKSLITSVCLMPWVWLILPTAPFICISFDEDLSYMNAQQSKDIIKSDEYQELFGDIYQIRKDSDSKGYFANTKGGFRLSKTVGANITGHKGLFILIDDPLNPKNAASDVLRNTANVYYTNSLYNRLTPVQIGLRVIIMQRLHELDLSGYLLGKAPDSYHHICLPAEVSHRVNPPELVKEYVDGLLDPNRLSKKVLNDFRSTLGSSGYAGQYMQSPSPDAGGIIRKAWFDIVQAQSVYRDAYKSPVHFILDTAFTDKTENDPTAILACFKQDNFLYVLDVQEVWLTLPDLCKYLINYTQRWQYSSYSKIFVEPKASGLPLVQTIRATTMLNIVELKSPKDSKVTRAQAVTPIIESRRVRLVDGPYVESYLGQLTLFPNGAHDDMVDVTVYAIDELLKSNGPDILWL
jgi:predicted phage terminase large subunit-like protein